MKYPVVTEVFEVFFQAVHPSKINLLYTTWLFPRFPLFFSYLVRVADVSRESPFVVMLCCPKCALGATYFVIFEVTRLSSFQKEKDTKQNMHKFLQNLSAD